MDIVYIFLVVSCVLVSVVVSVEINKFFMFDRRCIAKCWFDENSKWHFFFNNGSLFLGLFSMLSALIMVGLIFLKIHVISNPESFALASSVILTIFLYKRKIIPHLKPEANAVHIKSLTALGGSSFGVIILFGFIMSSVPEFDTTKDIFENISYDINNIHHNSLQIVNLYMNFNAYISNFSWYGMLKLSDTFQTEFVVFAWVVFVFSSIGFFIVFNFSSLVILDLFRTKKKSEDKVLHTQESHDEDNKDCGLYCKYKTELGMIIGFSIFAYGIYSIEVNLQDKKIQNEITNSIDWNATIDESPIEKVFADTRVKIINTIQPYKSIAGIEAPFKEIDGELNTTFNEAGENLKKALSEELNKMTTHTTKLEHSFKNSYQFGSTVDENKKVYEYIFKDTKE